MGEDYFLTIGGGYSPSGNQASLEKNVLYFQRSLAARGLAGDRNDIFFADGNDKGEDLEVLDRDSVPKANRLMAEFFGSTANLGLSYRNHRVANVRGSTSPANIKKWFREVGPSLKKGDRLIVYVTAHGSSSSNRQTPYDTTIAMWNNSRLRMREFVGLLDGLDQGVQVVCIMVQCHAGGFARFIFEDGDPDKGLAKQKRVGFFATVHDRQAAGCTSDVDEASYVEYSTYFWAAVTGKDRLGNAIERPDYNGDGAVSMDEAHAYTVISANTIDLPVMSSGEFLTKHGRYGKSGSGLLTDDASYDDVLSAATPSQKAVLEALSEQLELSGSDRIMAAYRATQSRGGNQAGRSRVRGRSRQDTPEARLRLRIRTDLRKRWPELANPLNPGSIELLTTRKAEFISAVETHRSYAEYRKLQNQKRNNATQKARVKYERFLRTVDNVIFAENLRREKNEDLIRQYEAIVVGESSVLFE